MKYPRNTKHRAYEAHHIYGSSCASFIIGLLALIVGILFLINGGFH